MSFKLTIFCILVLVLCNACANDKIIYGRKNSAEIFKQVEIGKDQAKPETDLYKEITGDFVSTDLPKIKSANGSFVPYGVRRLKIVWEAISNVLYAYEDDIVVAKYENIFFDYANAKNKGDARIEDPWMVETDHLELKITDGKCHLLVKFGKAKVNDKDEELLITSLSSCAKLSEFYGWYKKIK